MDTDRPPPATTLLEPTVSHGWRHQSPSIAQQDCFWQRIPKSWTSPVSCGWSPHSAELQPLWSTSPSDPHAAAERSFTGFLPLRFCNLSSWVKKAWLCKARNLPEDGKLSLFIINVKSTWRLFLVEGWNTVRLSVPKPLKWYNYLTKKQDIWQLMLWVHWFIGRWELGAVCPSADGHIFTKIHGKKNQPTTKK